MQYVPGVPDSNFAAVFYGKISFNYTYQMGVSRPNLTKTGKLSIDMKGTYTFCTTSNAGYGIYLTIHTMSC